MWRPGLPDGGLTSCLIGHAATGAYPMDGQAAKPLGRAPPKADSALECET